MMTVITHLAWSVPSLPVHSHFAKGNQEAKRLFGFNDVGAPSASQALSTRCRDQASRTEWSCEESQQLDSMKITTSAARTSLHGTQRFGSNLCVCNDLSTEPSPDERCSTALLQITTVDGLTS